MDWLPKEIGSALARLNAAGYEAYLVGGCVRDRQMGRQPGDYDIATSALPEETEQVFSGERVLETGLRHGTVTVLLASRPIEITTFRVDGQYTDGRHPDSVRFTRTLREDLARRDFTVNAMAWSPETGLTDPFGGREDLENRLIRCVGDPEKRFGEDALRILRGLRFAAQLDFAIAPDTDKALRALRGTLDRVSRERVFAELGKLLCGKAAGRVLRSYPEMLGQVIPEIVPMVGFDQHNIHHIYDVWEHTARVVDAIPPTRVLRLAALLHDIGKPACFRLDGAGTGHFRGHDIQGAQMADGILRALRCGNAERERIVKLIYHHDWNIPATAKGARRALARLGEADFFDLLVLKRADNLAQSPAYRGRQAEYDELERIARELLAQKACLSLRDLAVRGGDLIALGVPPGPKVGKALQTLLDAVLDGSVENDRDALLTVIRERMVK
ncbi:MAG: HD domain-containing protein [Oscillospiraceae bacterium]|nr:HD domain-containing protein [Oscillospiraceae bacterium]